MRFSTPVPTVKSSVPISYDSTVFSIGSCFAENISAKLSHFKFGNAVNPFGILFHPGAIAKFIAFAVDGKQFSGSDIFFQNERWHSFDAHSNLSGSDSGELVAKLNSAVRSSFESIRNASHFIITLGTAWAYREIQSNALVANCHKIPQQNFSKELLPPDEVSGFVGQCIDAIHSVNPSAQLIFTISPVRHSKDGFVENQRSKANLISGLHSAIERRENAYYFPSYEIVMDELRDYRFYASDMLHPNEVAIDYIWEKFSDAWISDASKSIMAEVDSIRKALSHRPFAPESESHGRFLLAIEKRIELLKQQHPNLSFTNMVV